MTSIIWWLKFIAQWIVGAIIVFGIAILFSIIVIWAGNIFVNVGLFIIIIVTVFSIIIFFKKQKIDFTLIIIFLLIGMVCVFMGWSFRTGGTYKVVQLSKNNSNQFVGNIFLDLNDKYFINGRIKANKVVFAVQSYGLGCSPNYTVIINHNNFNKKYLIGNGWYKNQSFMFNVNLASQQLFAGALCNNGGPGHSTMASNNTTAIIPIDFVVDSGNYNFIILPSLGHNLDWVKVEVMNYQ